MSADARAPGPRLVPGSPAPAATVLDARGTPVPLARLWRDGPAALVFLRHFG